MAQYRTTKGRNPQLGNSLISLGPHGGILYKSRGSKDSYGLHKHKINKVYSSTNSEEWDKYTQSINERKAQRIKQLSNRRWHKGYIKKAGKVGRKKKKRSWPSLTISVYYYHKKNLILENDSFSLKEAHYCNSKECILLRINNGKITIKCKKCNKRIKIRYTRFLSLYYEASKQPFKDTCNS